MAIEVHPAKCLTSPSQNCQNHQKHGKAKKLSQPVDILRHNIHHPKTQKG